MLEETQVVVEKQADVVDAVLEHGDALHPQAEGEAGVFFGVVAHGLEDRGMDHARPQDLQPAGGLADPAALAPADDAGDVDFGGGFGEGEIAGAEAQADLGAEHLVHELGEHALQVGEGDVAVHQEPLHLVKHGGVGHVRVPAVDLARGDDAHRGPAFLHDPDLHGGGVGAQQHLVVEIKGVLHVPGRVVRREIQGLEIVPVQLDLGAGDGLETQVQEDVADLLHGAGEGMEAAQGTPPAWQGNVDGQGPGPGRGLFERGEGLGQGALQTSLGPVGCRTHQAAGLRVQVLEPPQNLGENPLAPQVLDPQGLQGLGIGSLTHLPPTCLYQL